MYGSNPDKWKFRCPACGHVQTAKDAVAVCLGKNSVYRACTNGFMNKRGCRYWIAEHNEKCRLIVITEMGLHPYGVFEFADELTEGGR